MNGRSWAQGDDWESWSGGMGRPLAVVTAAVAIVLTAAVGMAAAVHVDGRARQRKVAAAGAASIDAGDRASPPPATFAVKAPSSSFAPGACMGFRPLSADRHFVVFVDAGHGGADSGTVGRTTGGMTVEEATETLAMGLRVRDVLLNAGLTVVLSRTQDSSVAALGEPATPGAYSPEQTHRDLDARVACANAGRAGAVVSIHMNAFEDPTVGGAETIYCAVRDFAPESLRLASLMQGAVVAAEGPVPNRGVVSDAGQGATTPGAPPDFGHTHLLGPAYPGWNTVPSAMPGVIVEPLFLTDPTEASMAVSPAVQDALADAIAKAIEAFAAASAPAQGH